MRIPQQVRSSGFDLQLTAMINVGFLLLIFFLWTNNFERPEFALGSALSTTAQGDATASTTTAPSTPFDEIIIKIQASQASPYELRLNDMPLKDRAELFEHLRSIMAIGVQPPVIVQPDPAISMEVAISIFDAACLAGCDRVLFAVRPKTVDEQ